MDIIRRKKIPKEKMSGFENFQKNEEVFFQNTGRTIRPEIKKLQSQINKHTKKRFALKKTFLLFLSVILILMSATAIYFFWKINSVSHKIILTSETDQNKNNTDLSAISERDKTLLQGENDGRINILLLGIAGENKPGKNLTDTVMIMNIDTRTKKIGLLSLPRDLYVNIPKTQNYTKINSIYQYGINENQGIGPIKKTIENITGLNIHYFLVVDFEGFEKVIDTIGGINIDVQRDIYDPRYPGPNYSYETFEIKKGLHKMDGATALKYARERHADPEGDFGRAKRQQQVIQAVKNKSFSLKTFLNVITLNKLLDALGDHIKTNIELEEISRFLALGRQLDTQNISTAVIDAWEKDSLLKVSHIFNENTRMFILIPRVGNYSEIQELANNIFDLDFTARKNTEIATENAKIAIINATSESNLTEKILDLLQNKMNFTQITVIQNPTKQQSPSTSIFDATNTSKLFSLNEISSKLPATIIDERNAIMENAEIGNYDFVITLGNDLIPLYSFEEDSIKDLQNATIDQTYPDLL
jgi:LCP family protein required for cell wall assembly